MVSPLGARNQAVLRQNRQRLAQHVAAAMILLRQGGLSRKGFILLIYPGFNVRGGCQRCIVVVKLFRPL